MRIATTFVQSLCDLKACDDLIAASERSQGTRYLRCAASLLSPHPSPCHYAAPPGLRLALRETHATKVAG